MLIQSKLAGAMMVLTAGCAASPSANPSFPVTVAEAQADLHRMRDQPRKANRPIVILNGFGDPGAGGVFVGGELRRDLSSPDVLCVSFLFCGSFDDCRRKVIRAVDRKWPSDDPNATVEVDVIGLSMGGLVARYCVAEPTTAGRRLKVHRLFTVSSPHQGATRAQSLPPLLKMQIDMRPRSDFLRRLEAAEQECSCEIYPYVRLKDEIVGEQYASPPGKQAWWVSKLPLQPAHIGAATDPRILADILRRLRDETPLTTEPAAPLPSVQTLQ
jgi:pimeloyl-ACP methyl ester carboxylesterase